MTLRRVTIDDLAREAGVSKTAVSRSLSGKPGVSEETRARVRELARERGWRPNATARSLSGAQAGAIGWVVRRTPKSSTIDPYFMDLLVGVQLELASTPYNLVLKLVDAVEDELRVYEEWHAERRVDGVLVADVEIEDRRILRLGELGLPAAGICGEDSSRGLAAHVTARDAEGVETILQHLRDAGHRRIGWVTGPREFAATARREAALARAMASFEDVVVTEASLDAAASAGAAATMALRRGVSAVVVDNEFAAIETVECLRARGLDVPGDVAVVSWLGSDLCLLSDPTITALEHDVRGIGRDWTRALVAAVYGAEPAPPVARSAALRVRASSPA